ncbi:MAG: Holliday junction resolvase RuvX [Mariprofundales bacterium]
MPNNTSCSITNTKSSKPIKLPLLAVDIGTRRIGVAVSDRFGFGARGIAVLGRNDKQWPQQLIKHLQAYSCCAIIIGLPRNMDGSEGKQAKDCRKAGQILQQCTQIEIIFWDERLSTWTARQRLYERGLRKKKVDAIIDQEAAAVILESYLAAHPELKK